MAYRRQPITVFASALALFLICAILPVSYMLVKFVAGVIQNPSETTSVLLDGRQLVLLARSMGIALGATMVSLVLGLPCAFILAAKDLPGRKLFYLLTAMPLMIPPYVMTGAWVHLLVPEGFVNTALKTLFGSGAQLSLFSGTGCAWCLGISHFPIVAIMCATGLSKTDRNLHDVARLSTGRWGVFRVSTLPQILPHLMSATCLVLVFVLGRYGVPSLLGVNTYPVEIFAQFSAFYDNNAAMATAMPLMILVVVLILVQRRLMFNRSYVSIAPSSESDNPMALGTWKYAAMAWLLVLFVVIIVLPFASVAWRSESLSKAVSILGDYHESIVATSMLACLAALISTTVALPIGFYLARSSSKSSQVLDVICWLPIAIPGTILGLGFIGLGSLVPSLRNADSFGFLLLVAYVGMFSAFSIRILQASLQQADPNIEDTLALEKCGWHQRLIHIDFPLHARAMATSFIIVFVLTVGELNATVLLVPPGKETLAVTIDNLLHYGANVNASVLCLAEAVLVIIVVLTGLGIWKLTMGRNR